VRYMNKGTFLVAAFSFANAALVPPFASNKICSLTALLVHKKGSSVIIVRLDI